MLDELLSKARGFGRTLLEEVGRGLQRVPGRLVSQHAVFVDGTIHLAVHSPNVANEVSSGDFVYGGIFVAHDPAVSTEFGVRIYRVACRNGLLADGTDGHLVEFASAKPPRRWRRELAAVIEAGFAGGYLDEESRRLRRALEEILASPYEFLLNLRAQGLITDDEQERIQHDFAVSGDASVYGLVNAITRQAHLYRNRSDWRRALALERLGGEISRGEHQPPIGAPVHR